MMTTVKLVTPEGIDMMRTCFGVYPKPANTIGAKVETQAFGRTLSKGIGYIITAEVNIK